MNKLACCKKKTKLYELQFINLCTEGCYQEEYKLDALWNQAMADGNQEDQILNAVDDEGDTPL